MMLFDSQIVTFIKQVLFYSACCTNYFKKLIWHNLCFIYHCITVKYSVPTLRTVMGVPHLFSQEGMTMREMARPGHTVPERTMTGEPFPEQRGTFQAIQQPRA